MIITCENIYYIEWKAKRVHVGDFRSGFWRYVKKI